MTDKHQAIAALIEAIDAGWLEFLAADSAIGHKNAQLAEGAFLGSLDEARSLHEVLLPGWHRLIWGSKSFAASVQDTQYPNSKAGGRAKTESRAWLLAILRAYASQLTAPSNRKGAAE
jgi:hypothetical protein